MSERFTRIFEGEQDLYIKGSPVLIKAHVLLRDNMTGSAVAQLKYQNTVAKTIKYIKVLITPYDMLKQPAGAPQTFEYRNLNVTTRAIVGSDVPIILSDSSAASYKVCVLGVAFDDGDVWISEETVWVADKQITAELLYDEAVLCMDSAKTTEEYKKAAELFNNAGGIKDSALLYAKCIDIADRILKEAEEKAARQTEAKQKKARKTVRVLLAILIPVVCIAIGSVILISAIKSVKYNLAVDKFNKGDYKGAYNTFYTILDYKDSKDYYDSISVVKGKTVTTSSKGNTSVTTVKYLLDTMGRIVKVEETSSNDNKSTREYSYNESGDVIKLVSTFSDSFGNGTSIIEYSYDSKGNRTKIFYTYVDVSTHISEFFYDEKGKVIMEISTYSSGTINKYEYYYDNNDNLTKELHTYIDDKYTSTDTTMFFYDEDGNKVKEEATNSDGDTTTREYSFDDNGNIIKDVNTDPHGLKLTWTYSYDEKGNMIKLTYEDYNGYTYVYEYFYDDSGNLIKLKSDEFIEEYSDFIYISTLALKKIEP